MGHNHLSVYPTRVSLDLCLTLYHICQGIFNVLSKVMLSISLFSEMSWPMYPYTYHCSTTPFPAPRGK